MSSPNLMQSPEVLNEDYLSRIARFSLVQIEAIESSPTPCEVVKQDEHLLNAHAVYWQKMALLGDERAVMYHPV